MHLLSPSFELGFDSQHPEGLEDLISYHSKNNFGLMKSLVQKVILHVSNRETQVP